MLIYYLQLTMNENEKFKRCAEKIPRNALYTSPQIQNELIEAMTTCLPKKLVEELNEANFLTILVDGTKDKHFLLLFVLSIKMATLVRIFIFYIIS